MARHRKSPRSGRNLLVFDLLFPPKGNQYDPRVKFFSESWSTDHSCKFDMPHDHVQKIEFLKQPTSVSDKATDMLKLYPWGSHG